MNSTNENNLSESISNEIMSTCIDLSLDYAELTLDGVLSDTIQEIPIVKTLYSIGKIGIAIKERFFIKKLLMFLKQFHTGTIDQNKLNDFKNKFDTDIQYRNKVTEHIMVFTDTFLQAEKSKIFANLFLGHITGKYDWEHFVSLSTCLNSINPKGFIFLKSLSENNFQIPEKKEDRKIKRNGENEALLYSCGIAYEKSAWSSSFNVSNLGKDLFNYGINGIL